MPTGPARSGRPDDKLRMVVGARGREEFASLPVNIERIS